MTIRIENEHLLTDRFGHWPSFHDAEIHRVRFEHNGADAPWMECDIHVFEMTITPKIFMFILLSMFLQSSVPAYIAAIIAKQKIIIHSIVFGSIFVLINIIGCFLKLSQLAFCGPYSFFVAYFCFQYLAELFEKLKLNIY